MIPLLILKNSAGIVTAADFFRKVTQGLFQKINVRNVIQIDDGTQFVCHV